MNFIKKLGINKLIGYILLVLYLIAAVVFIGFCTTLNMLPVLYLVIIGITLAIFGVIFAIMHEKLIPSIISSVLTILFIAGMIMGMTMIYKTNHTIQKVSTADTATDIIGVYVMDEDAAQSVEEAKDYTFGIISGMDRENTDKTIQNLNETLGTTLKTKEYEDMFVMADDLKAQKVQAIILNSAYLGIIGDEEGYNWVLTDTRQLTTVEHHAAVEQTMAIPEDIPETFIMYLSGIDTYGGVSARSRSDVNILAVVNIKTKDILLLSTPRDYYVEYYATNGAKDKLTHAGIYGVEASIDALETLYGIDVNYYLRVNFSGFIDIIDALGGIDVYSDYEFTVDPIKTYYVGTNHLTGLEALAFARERYSFPDGDYQRAKNQMEVIRAAVSKCASSSMLMNYGSVMDAVAGSIDTNMPEDQIASLVKMQLSDMAQWNISSYTATGTGTSAETFSMPGRQLSVIIPDEASIIEARQLINGIYGE